MKSYNQAKKILINAKLKIKDEIININSSLNRIVSENILSKVNYPAGDNAAFDGFAVRAQDTKKLSKNYNLSKDIMVARLEAYSSFPFNNKQTFFCDADCLFLNKLWLTNLNENIYLTIRSENSFINPEGYPEFENKTFLDMMPFLFGAMALKDGKQFFENLISICKDLPLRFHQWYGEVRYFISMAS